MTLMTGPRLAVPLWTRIGSAGGRSQAKAVAPRSSGAGGVAYRAAAQRTIVLVNGRTTTSSVAGEVGAMGRAGCGSSRGPRSRSARFSRCGADIPDRGRRGPRDRPGRDRHAIRSDRGVKARGGDGRPCAPVALANRSQTCLRRRRRPATISTDAGSQLGWRRRLQCARYRRRAGVDTSDKPDPRSTVASPTATLGRPLLV